MIQFLFILHILKLFPTITEDENSEIKNYINNCLPGWIVPIESKSLLQQVLGNHKYLVPENKMTEFIHQASLREMG